MSLTHTILGFLSWKPFTGYELKKLFSETDFIYWSGNNNQIYKSLVQLSSEKLVTREVVQQDSLPAKKIYHITDKGRKELHDWASSSPEFAQVKNTFLMQLAWSGELNDRELSNLIGEYQYEVEMRLAMCRTKLERRTVLPDRTEREEYIWEMLWQKEIDYLKGELNWLVKLSQGVVKRSGK